MHLFSGRKRAKQQPPSFLKQKITKQTLLANLDVVKLMLLQSVEQNCLQRKPWNHGRCRNFLLELAVLMEKISDISTASCVCFEPFYSKWENDECLIAEAKKRLHRHKWLIIKGTSQLSYYHPSQCWPT